MSYDETTASYIASLTHDNQKLRALVQRLGNGLLEQDERWGLYGDQSKQALKEFKSLISEASNRSAIQTQER